MFLACCLKKSPIEFVAHNRPGQMSMELPRVAFD